MRGIDHDGAWLVDTGTAPPHNCTRARRWAFKGESLLLMNTPRGCTSGSPEREGTCYSRLVGLVSTWKWVSLSFSSVHSVPVYDSNFALVFTTILRLQVTMHVTVEPK